MDDLPFTILPQLATRTMGFCIWCGKTPPEVVLRDEHIIPKSFGGHKVLAQGCCSNCEKNQSAYIGKCCDLMFSALRLHHGLPVSKKKKAAERTVRVLTKDQLTGGDDIKAIGHAEAPGVIAMPILDLPRKLSGEPAVANEFLFLGAYVRSTTDDAASRGRSLEEKTGAKALGITQTPVTEFYKVLAHIAHAYYMGSDNAVREESLMLPIAEGDVARASEYLGGWPFPSPEILPDPNLKGGIHQIYAYKVRGFGVDYLVAAIRLFTHLRPLTPTYLAVLCKRPIPRGEGHYSFAKGEDGGLQIDLINAET